MQQFVNETSAAYYGSISHPIANMHRCQKKYYLWPMSSVVLPNSQLGSASITSLQLRLNKMISPNHSTNLPLARVLVGGLSSYKDVQTGLQSWEDQPQPRAFEFINVNDKDGSRRAKSHAVKDSRRRQKIAESTRLQKLKEQCAQKIIAAGPVQVVETPARLPPVSITYLDRPKLDPFNILPAKLNCHRDMALVHSCG
jgi:hypothetical protein